MILGDVASVAEEWPQGALSYDEPLDWQNAMRTYEESPQLVQVVNIAEYGSVQPAGLPFSTTAARTIRAR